MNDNKITTFQDIEPQLKHIQTLETIYLERNPVQTTEGSAYRRKIILMLPQIQQLDATCVFFVLHIFLTDGVSDT